MADYVTCRVRLPRGMQSQVSALTRQEGGTVNQFIAIAVAEKLTTAESLEALAHRAKRADIKSFRQILGRRKKCAPESGDT